MEKNQKVIVVLGPTASGKTKIAVKLAKKLSGEIISADSRQVYKGMDIGTGKDLDEYKVKRQKSKGKNASQKSKVFEIPHYLIDIVSPKDYFSVSDWQKMAYQTIEEILKRGKVPIVCGGTGLYISALVYGYEFIQTSNYKLQTIRNRLNKLTLNQLLARLKKIDPKTYKIIDKNNRRRVQRALEIYYQTGRPKSAQLKKQKPPYQFLLLGLSFPYPILKKRIAKRLEKRLSEGLIDEVKRLREQGLSWARLNDFGLEYRLVAKYLRGEIDYQDMVDGLNKEIFHFAKRQLTWFRKNKDIAWLKNYSQAQKLINNFLI